jgi:hypothetical protein
MRLEAPLLTQDPNSSLSRQALGASTSSKDHHPVESTQSSHLHCSLSLLVFNNSNRSQPASSNHSKQASSPNPLQLSNNSRNRQASVSRHSRTDSLARPTSKYHLCHHFLSRPRHLPLFSRRKRGQRRR